MVFVTPYFHETSVSLAADESNIFVIAGKIAISKDFFRPTISGQDSPVATWPH